MSSSVLQSNVSSIKGRVKKKGEKMKKRTSSTTEMKRGENVERAAITIHNNQTYDLKTRD